jgi:AcrR family transcriptional regulator
VRAALELFTTKGYHESTTPQIAAAAGVAEGTIYRHFQSKEHLLNELYRAALRVLIDLIQQAPDGAACRNRLHHIATSWMGVAAQDPGLIRLVFLTRHGSSLDARSRDAMRQLEKGLGSVIASGKAAGEVRTGPVDVWVHVWIALTVMVLERVADGEWSADQSAPTQVIDAAWDAMRARNGATGNAVIEE